MGKRGAGSEDARKEANFGGGGEKREIRSGGRDAFFISLSLPFAPTPNPSFCYAPFLLLFLSLSILLFFISSFRPSLSILPQKKKNSESPSHTPPSPLISLSVSLHLFCLSSLFCLLSVFAVSLAPFQIPSVSPSANNPPFRLSAVAFSSLSFRSRFEKTPSLFFSSFDSVPLSLCLISRLLSDFALCLHPLFFRHSLARSRSFSLLRFALRKIFPPLFFGSLLFSFSENTRTLSVPFLSSLSFRIFPFLSPLSIFPSPREKKPRAEKKKKTKRRRRRRRRIDGAKKAKRDETSLRARERKTQKREIERYREKEREREREREKGISIAPERSS
jgi:hypothetical protein